MLTIRSSRGALLGAVAASLALASSASAADIVVDSPADPTATASNCTLRQAIQSANTNATVAGSDCVQGNGTDTITFDPAAFPPSPAVPTVIQQVNPPGEFVTTSQDLNIVGPGMNALEIRGAVLPAGGRIFNFLSGGANVALSGLSATQSTVSGPGTIQGGALVNSSNLTLSNVRVANNQVLATGAGAFGDGAGIYSIASATLTLHHSIVEDNTVSAVNMAGDATGATARGAGIWSDGQVTLKHSTIDDNDATATDGGTGTVEATGGGLRTTGLLTSHHSTISRNTATATTSGGAGADAQASGGGIASSASNNSLELSTVAANGLQASSGAGGTATQRGGGIIYNGGAGQLDLISATIARNGPTGTSPTPSTTSANISFVGGAIEAGNTIIADPVGPTSTNCDAAALSTNGFNLEYSTTAASCGLGAGTDLTSNPLLDPNLQNNGGPTQTIALLTGSPAIDKGSNAGQTLLFANEDQRGLARPSNFPAITDAANGTDIGAFEVQVSPVVTPPVVVTPPPAPAAATGLRAAALKKCKKKKSKRARRNCRKKAQQLPI